MIGVAAVLAGQDGLLGRRSASVHELEDGHVDHGCAALPTLGSVIVHLSKQIWRNCQSDLLLLPLSYSLSRCVRGSLDEGIR